MVQLYHQVADSNRIRRLIALTLGTYQETRSSRATSPGSGAGLDSRLASSSDCLRFYSWGCPPAGNLLERCAPLWTTTLHALVAWLGSIPLYRRFYIYS